jgi:hypothetical protein
MTKGTRGQADQQMWAFAFNGRSAGASGSVSHEGTTLHGVRQKPRISEAQRAQVFQVLITQRGNGSRVKKIAGVLIAREPS